MSKKYGGVTLSVTLCVLVWVIAARTVDGAEVGGKKRLQAMTDPEAAIKQFKVPAGFKVDLFAAEPQLMNPVAFCFDEKGRVFVAETFRYKTSVCDIRDHMNMFYDDLACRTVDDRAAMINKFAGPNVGLLTLESERVQLVEDRAGTGRADHSTVFAEGFNTVLDGIGAGVLARKGEVYYANIPNLWLLKDTNNDGTADVRTSLSYGYGVHFNLTGHDLHGLRMGPDGRLYFSIGDRGLNVTNREGRVLAYPDMGTVLRCEPDGANLEIFAYGVRNPQELAFDDHGDLFTGDNNCDHGDAARLVYVVEGGDSGWRTGNQFSETTPAGVWNSEKLWHLQFPGQAAYIVPPVAHIGNGPSGLAHYPGTGFADEFKDRFFLCDFRGGSVNSGVHMFGVQPKGAGFSMVGRTNFFWSILATDVEFSPDGRMFVSDWVEGWPQSGKGRLYRLYDPERVNGKLVLETKKLIAEGMGKRSDKELGKLLGHADQRVRQEAQFELESRVAVTKLSASGKKANGWSGAMDVLNRVATSDANQLARIHAIWAIGNISRKVNASALAIIELMAKDKDPEIRAQIAKAVGDVPPTTDGDYDLLVNYLKDTSPRVRSFAAIGLGKMAKINPLKNAATVRELFGVLRTNMDQDAFVRHAAVMGLTGLATQGDLVDAARDQSVSVRMGALLAMRRQLLPEIAVFLNDADPLIVLEAARAINDMPIKEAFPKLAALIERPTQMEMLDWRVINANFRLGGKANAEALSKYAGRPDAPERVRVEALQDLETWAQPSQRDRLTGLWRPLAPREGSVAAEALKPVMTGILTGPPEGLQTAAIRAVEKLSVKEAGETLYSLVTGAGPAVVRVEALRAMEELREDRLGDAVRAAVTDQNEDVRQEGNRLRAQMKPGEGAESLTAVLEQGTILEKQGAFSTLGGLPGKAADDLLAQWLDKLKAGSAPKEVQLELLEAAGRRSAEEVKGKLLDYLAAQPKDDEFAGFRQVLYGGNATAGKKIFFERAEVACTRCHKVKGDGGDVGPDLTGIITRHDREYILESMLYPNRQIAPGFENLLVTVEGGQIYAGILKSETASELVLNSPDDGIIRIKKSDIKARRTGQSGMPEGLAALLSKSDLRNLVEFISTAK